MAEELVMYPGDGVANPTAQIILEALVQAGLPCTEQPDQYGHWLALDGCQSTVYLTLEDGVARAALFRFVTGDDRAICRKVANVFTTLGWSVAVDESTLKL